VTSFKNKINKPLLDFKDDTFDRDFVEFNVEVSLVENALTAYIDSNFAVIVNIEDSLKLLRKFDAILERNNLKSGLKDKYNLLFAQYAKLLAKIDKQYNNDWKNPPIVRNLPIVAGSITWSRHLFHRASVPMEHFPRELLKRDSKPAKQVKEHNKVTINLFHFEYEWRVRWAQEVEKAKVGLLATLIIRHPNNNKLYVNFDAEIMTMIREAKCLSRLGIEIPESAKIVLLQEEKFKMYNNELQFVLSEYDRIVNKIRPNTKSLLVPHLEDLEYKLRPGMNTLTWTSMNIDGYLQHVHKGLAKLEQLIININDIMENRIENNLKTLSKTVLVNLPQESSTYTLDEFVEMQSQWIATESNRLKSKNYEVEQAVEDLIQTICSYQLDQNVEPISAEEIHKLSKYYSWSMYQALLHATKYSLNQMKERICGRRNSPKQILKPFFEVDVHLDGNQSILKPSLADVQLAINKAAQHVLKSTRKVQLWFQKETPEDKKEPFYNWIARDKEIVKVILLLTGSIQGTKSSVYKFLEDFSVYSWLWTKRPEDQLKVFIKEEPSLEDYEEKLKEFDIFNGQIDEIQETHQIGALSLKTMGVKSALSRYINSWKTIYAKEIHKQAKGRLGNLADEIKQIRLKIEKPVKDIDSLGSVMNALEDIRKKESNINFQFKPITDMYSMIETILADYIDRDELHQHKNLLKEWESLVTNAIVVRNNLHEEQAEFKKQLIENIQTLVKDVKVFREDFEKNGPMQADLTPGEALNKLKDFKEQFSVHNRKFHSYKNGENLFALPNQDYPALVKTQGELEKLDKLYVLYLKVTETIAKWKETPWLEITDEVEKMKEGTEQYLKDCSRLPMETKNYPAYKDLKKELDDMETVLPLVEMLADKSIKERHWEQLIQLTGKDVPYSSETFLLKDLLAADLLSVQEDIEDISDNAIKQMKIDRQLREDIELYWETAELEVKTYQSIDVPCTIGGSVALHQEKLEDHIITLVQMSAMRCVEPFRADVNAKLDTYSAVTETLDKWLKVMTYWMNLVAVFTSGDIAKQMPLESKTFRNVDTQWKKIMERAAEQKNFIQCCQNDFLVNSLPKLQEDLEFCQKRLDSYLESKRQVFPRFYFCSPNDLLKILSLGSDPHQVQDDFALLFDSVKKVTFDKADRSLINSIHFDGGGAVETVEFDEPVKAEGLIEEWLCRVESEMQRSVRSVCAGGAQEVFSMPLLDFVNKYIAQVALLGVQILWTQKVTDCLERGKDRMQVFKEKEKEIKSIMNDLVGLCKTEIPTKQDRTKIETLVTIHVYQKQLFEDIMRAANRGQIKDTSDFDWQKNARFYWRQDAKGEGQVIVSITDVDFTYQYEYLGVKERLCVTVLTEKCYISLAQALKMCLGGAPAGPAGTGKTETVKDLGCTLGIFVVVTNCSGEHRQKDMAKIFKGVCQSGLWGCFDEFNRIFLDTLSVVAA
jgi:dynein heavy chain, axonemal